MDVVPMSQARRRAPQRDDLDIETTLKRAVVIAPEIELGMSQLRQAMRESGWRSRVPDGDRRSGGGQQEPACIDYADDTGNLALRLDHLADDLDALQDHWHLVTTSLRAMAVIARKHIPASSPAPPACSVSQCDGTVEATPNGGYRGMERIAGVWVAKPGQRPVCARHRRAA